MSVRLLTGDCRVVLPTLSAESVQCVVSSPPYLGLRDYGCAGQIGLEPSPGEYVQALVEVFREVRRVLHPTGTVWLNLGDSYAGGGGYAPNAPSNLAGSKSGRHGGEQGSRTKGIKPSGLIKPKDLLMIPARVAIALQDDGWYLRADCIWHKLNPMPESVRDRPTSAHEHVFLLTRSPTYFYDAEAVAERTATRLQARLTGTADQPKGAARAAAGGQNPLCQGGTSDVRNLRNVWSLVSETCSLAHFALMPTALAEICIKAGTSEKGCCPACKAPWRRVTERETVNREGYAAATKDHHAGLAQAQSWVRDGKGRAGDVRVATLGWEPSCSCPAHEPVPCTVLDPFAGGGTSLLCADRLQRHAIGIELNERYCDLIRARLTGDAPLFVDVVAA